MNLNLTQNLTQDVVVRNVLSVTEAPVSGFNTTVSHNNVSQERIESIYRNTPSLKRQKISENVSLDTPPAKRLVGIETNPGPISMKVVPAPRLVGIEENPGPKAERKSSVQRKKQTVQKNSLSGVLAVPASMSRTFSRTMPVQKYMSNGDILVSHREYFTDMNSFSAFVPGPNAVTQKGILINPGNSTLFPWLSRISAAYEQYRFEKLNFQYVTQVSTNTNGRVIIAVDYDPTDSPPIDKTNVLTFKGAVSAPSWSECKYVCSPSDLSHSKVFFVSPGNIAQNSTVGGNALDRQNATGTLWACSKGGTGAVTGELYVDYTVRLMVPQLSSGVTPYIEFDAQTPVLLNPFGIIPLGFDYGTLSDSGITVLGPGTMTTTHTALQFSIPGRYVFTQYYFGVGLTSSSISTFGSAFSGVNIATINTTATTISGWATIDIGASGGGFFPNVTGTSLTQATFVVARVL